MSTDFQKAKTGLAIVGLLAGLAALVLLLNSASRSGLLLLGSAFIMFALAASPAIAASPISHTTAISKSSRIFFLLAAICYLGTFFLIIR